jgi:hypothetical protein
MATSAHSRLCSGIASFDSEPARLIYGMTMTTEPSKHLHSKYLGYRVARLRPDGSRRMPFGSWGYWRVSLSGMVQPTKLAKIAAQWILCSLIRLFQALGTALTSHLMLTVDAILRDSTFEDRVGCYADPRSSKISP